jgi:hypothetical protein
MMSVLLPCKQIKCVFNGKHITGSGKCKPETEKPSPVARTDECFEPDPWRGRMSVSSMIRGADGWNASSLIRGAEAVALLRLAASFFRKKTFPRLIFPDSGV